MTNLVSDSAAFRPSTSCAQQHFPGVRSENAPWLRAEMLAMLDHWFDWRKHRFDETVDATTPIQAGEGHKRLSERLAALQEALTEETPTFTPRYVAHMKSDLSLPAILGWFAAMLHNPNNTSREASRVGSLIEAEAIAHLARMLGYDPSVAQGHFTSGGTVANFEAVWRARYRLDHWLAMALFLSEERGEPMDPFAAAHMGWDRFRALWREHGLTEPMLKQASAMASNPIDVQRRISKAAGFDYLGPVLIAPGNRHYSWNKAVNLFGLGHEALWSVRLDAHGRMDLDDFERLVLRAREQNRPVLMTVGVTGTTELSAVDPIDGLFDRLDRWQDDHGWHIWRHVDGAYGGFFSAMLDDDQPSVVAADVEAALRALPRADSITIDPHKLGYIPYACGAFLTSDVQAYAVSAFDAPYLHRPELGAGKWASTLEGSRSAAGAAATWLTAETLGLGPDGLGAVLAGTIQARRALEAAVTSAIPEVRFLPADANIACFTLAGRGEPLSVSNDRTDAVFAFFQRSPAFAVSRTVLGKDCAALKAAHLASYGGVDDSQELLVIRLVVMSPYWCDAEVSSNMAAQFIDELTKALNAVNAATPEVCPP
ncbi:pyridoxal phosphate-dependent decarboxylase family protein [Brevundimonas aveniformis]|uniref:pyridoxal phosphate-dependent decarboxylase family protein n=1 Tax=Brevundimonas aveniformis TaxID=370977 RepID=UPI0024936B53|nr:pyridoxal-dependent decarboxylase [Brevundimonas aveniformis]